MKDFLGNELNIGDEVVYMCLGYRSLNKGFINKMSAKTIWISHTKILNPRTLIKQTPDQVVKIPKVIPAEILEAQKYVASCESDFGFMGSPTYAERNY